MISDNKELGERIQSIKNKLMAAGEDDWNSALDDALSISTVPGEIWGETRLQLQRLLQTDVAKDSGLKSQVVDVITYLNRFI